jgi:hypothetical protein
MKKLAGGKGWLLDGQARPCSRLQATWTLTHRNVSRKSDSDSGSARAAMTALTAHLRNFGLVSGSAILPRVRQYDAGSSSDSVPCVGNLASRMIDLLCPSCLSPRPIFVVVASVSVRVGISAEGSGGSGHGIEAHGGLGDGAMDGALGGRLGDGARGKERA